MTYEKVLKQIFALHRFKKVPGLANLRVLLHTLGDPQKKLRFVHVAGTNGKGSVSTMTASVLQHSGFRTGLFTSPFVIDFRERMQINGSMISPEELVNVAEKVFPPLLQMERGGQEISEFEAVTALGLCWFAQQKCDLVVLEVGLGGRLDATNVIAKPMCAVITHISYDHTEILGDTLTKIAGEKCGILKEGLQCGLCAWTGARSTCHYSANGKGTALLFDRGAGRESAGMPKHAFRYRLSVPRASAASAACRGIPSAQCGGGSGVCFCFKKSLRAVADYCRDLQRGPGGGENVRTV
jgi:folylpolyglutamate synthase/dihydrofolate synthase